MKGRKTIWLLSRDRIDGFVFLIRQKRAIAETMRAPISVGVNSNLMIFARIKHAMFAKMTPSTKRMYEPVFLNDAASRIQFSSIGPKELAVGVACPLMRMRKETVEKVT